MANLRLLQDTAGITLDIEHVETPPEIEVDAMLVDLASEKDLRIVTTDANLARVAEIRGVATLNLHDLGDVLKDPAVPGEQLQLSIVRPGEAAGQGIGYLPDGTMVVVEDASDRIGSDITVVITNAVQTSAGRLVFAKVSPDEPAGLARSATTQPRHHGPGPHNPDAN